MDTDFDLIPSDDSQSWPVGPKFSGAKPKSRLGRRKKLGNLQNKEEFKKKEEDANKATIWLQHQNQLSHISSGDQKISTVKTIDIFAANSDSYRKIQELTNSYQQKSINSVIPQSRQTHFSNPLRDIINLPNDCNNTYTVVKRKNTYTVVKSDISSIDYKDAENRDQCSQDKNLEKSEGIVNSLYDVTLGEEHKDSSFSGINKTGQDSFCSKTPGKSFSSFLNFASPIDILSGILSGNEDSDDFITAIGNVKTPCTKKFNFPNGLKAIEGKHKDLLDGEKFSLKTKELGQKELKIPEDEQNKIMGTDMKNEINLKQPRNSPNKIDVKNRKESDSGFFDKQNVSENFVNNQKLITCDTYPQVNTNKQSLAPPNSPMKYYESIKHFLNPEKVENHHTVKKKEEFVTNNHQGIEKTPDTGNSSVRRDRHLEDSTNLLTFSNHSLSNSVSSHNQRISFCDDQKSNSALGNSITVISSHQAGSVLDHKTATDSKLDLHLVKENHLAQNTIRNPVEEESIKYIAPNYSVPPQVAHSMPQTHFYNSEAMRHPPTVQGYMNPYRKQSVSNELPQCYRSNQIDGFNCQNMKPQQEPMREIDHEFQKPWAVQSHSSSTHNIFVNGKPYSALSLLGRGGSSEVYQVLEPKTTQLMAIKCVNLASQEESITNGYLNEIELLSKLQGCSSVIRMFDHEYVEQTKRLYVVMEKGDTDFSKLMKEISKTKKISMLMVIYYWNEMLNCVKDIHDQGIIHSDLKPANFLLVSGRLKLIDFGIASTLQGDMTSVVKDVATGTFNYMSPEAIQNSGEVGRSYKISYKSDVWSLGCILYNMVFGRTPFSHIHSTWAKLQAIADPKLVVEIPKNGRSIPLELKIALLWCLRKEPKSRPSVHELLRLFDHSGTDGSHVTAQYNAFKFKYYKGMFPNCPDIENCMRDTEELDKNV